VGVATLPSLVKRCLEALITKILVNCSNCIVDKNVRIGRDVVIANTDVCSQTLAVSANNLLILHFIHEEKFLGCSLTRLSVWVAFILKWD
jgi:hypothetical protein